MSLGWADVRVQHPKRTAVVDASGHRSQAPWCMGHSAHGFTAWKNIDGFESHACVQWARLSKAGGQYGAQRDELAVCQQVRVGVFHTPAPRVAAACRCRGATGRPQAAHHGTTRHAIGTAAPAPRFKKKRRSSLRTVRVFRRPRFYVCRGFSRFFALFCVFSVFFALFCDF